ncbi:hypothetical protein EMGBS15_10150 [Filimonas sp.]|nr:hypothetical protein EMGBS15_10150 [Filimonas sp.]
MEDDELAFIQKRYLKESKLYMFGMNRVLIAAVVIPFLAALIYYVRFERNDIMIQAFLYALAITLIFSGIIAFFSYKRGLLDIKKDLKEKTKIVESALITEKKYMALNHTWHFYLHKAFKYTIEVSEADFDRFEVNDEINIEYSRYSKEYFGYY